MPDTKLQKLIKKKWPCDKHIILTAKCKVCEKQDAELTEALMEKYPGCMDKPKSNEVDWEVKKIIPEVKVEDAGIYSRKQIREMSLERKRELGLIMSNGKMNDYRYYQFIGQGGSAKEESWNKAKHKHNCCGSKVAWRHTTGCKPELPDDPDDLSDLKDIKEVVMDCPVCLKEFIYKGIGNHYQFHCSQSCQKKTEAKTKNQFNFNGSLDN